MSILRPGQHGFTLIELLVAVAIFAILGVMAYSGLNVVLNTQERTQQAAERLQALQFAVRMLERDLRFFVPRPVRNAYGDAEPALVVREGAPQLTFTHAAARNPAGLPRANLQRVAYLLDDDVLVRVTWSRLDGADEEDRLRTPLITGLDAFEVRVLTPNGSWTDRWPTAGADSPKTPYPQAVELQMASDEWGQIRRVIPIAAQRPAQAVQTQAGGQPPKGGQPPAGERPAPEGKARGAARSEGEDF